MLTLCHGNLLDDDTEALVNPVNCVGVMEKGLALQFKRKFPDYYRTYVLACRAELITLGRILLYQRSSLDKPRYLISFPTKRHWKDQSHIDDIILGLTSLTRQVEAYKIQSIALPALGCGNGGLNWIGVQRVIESAFMAVPLVDVRLYEPQ